MIDFHRDGDAIVRCAAHSTAAAAPCGLGLFRGVVAKMEDTQATAAQREVGEPREAPVRDAARSEILVHVESQVTLRRAVADVDVGEDGRECLPRHPE